jgi:NhaD family Na+/H+ antiporter
MEILIIAVFTAAYMAIAFEHPLKLNKTSSALMGGVLCWTIYALLGNDAHIVNENLSEHLSSIAEVLFFLLGAMVVVELVDAHGGFDLITNQITTANPKKLIWIIAIITFFMSSVLDNLTTAIVMVTLLKKIVSNSEQRKLFAGLVIIAANAGGAWSPIGDVTTTMLWIGGQVSTQGVFTLFLPSFVCLLVPTFLMSLSLQNDSLQKSIVKKQTSFHGNLMLSFGVGGLVFVPLFKTYTHLPPYMGMLLVLGIVWLVSEVIHSDKDEETKKPYTVGHALSKADTSSVLFFLGILIAIGSLESTGILGDLSVWMDQKIGNQNFIAVAIGLASAIVDNVPLVAATMGMYDLSTLPMDAPMWKAIALSAGTGGSILIIGSAAGVAVMGMEKIDFGWYLRKVSFPALAGFLAGLGLFILMN